MRFGYGYGSSDQDEFIPLLLHLIQPDLFENDWFVNSQTASFSIRTYLVYLLRGLCYIFPPWIAVLGVYALSWMGIATAVFALGYRLTEDRLASIAAMFLALVFTPLWTLGGNDLAHRMLVPSMCAWAIGLWAVVHAHAHRPMLAAALLGIATWFQALVGLQLAGLMGCAILLGMCFTRSSFSDEQPSLIGFGAVYIVTAAPSLIPLFYQQLAAIPIDQGSSDLSLFYIMASFRAPHHYLFFSFDVARMIRFAGLVLCGCLALIGLRRGGARVRVRCIIELSVLCTIFCLIGFVGSELLQILTIAKLQLFKTTVILKLLMCIALCAGIAKALPTSVYRFFDRMAFRQTWMPALVVLAAAAGVYLIQPGRFGEKIYPLYRTNSPIAHAESWIAANTPSDALFAIPPSVSSFRSHARRGIMINAKAFPFRDQDIFIWFERITNAAPIKLPDRTDGTLFAKLDEAYHELSEEQLEALTDLYQLDYVLRAAPLQLSRQAFEQVYESGGYVLYKRRGVIP